MAVNAKNWQELKKPNALERKPGTDVRRKANFVAEPLERGFGMTLGNSLRRVLLSSLQGAAVTSIKIEGVLHEFSSLTGVREDVTDIILNVKQIALKMEGEGPKRLQLSATGPGEVTAGQIATSGDIEVTAAPCSDDSSTRLSELPSVMPKPRSSGSATNDALRRWSVPGLRSSALGFLSSCQFFALTAIFLPWQRSRGVPQNS